MEVKRWLYGKSEGTKADYLCTMKTFNERTGYKPKELIELAQFFTAHGTLQRVVAVFNHQYSAEKAETTLMNTGIISEQNPDVVYSRRKINDFL